MAGVAGAAAAAAGGGVYHAYFRKPSSDDGFRVAGAAAAERRILGRTGLPVSVLGIGAGGVSDPAVIARAVDLGMNYIDTATCYGDSEKVIGRTLAEYPGLRDKLVIATKWDPAANTPKATMLASLATSLKQMGVDHVDIMQIHWLGGGHRGIPGDDGFARLDNPELYAAMEEAKKAGKVRFLGATSHAGQRSKILRHAVAKGAFDTLLVKLNVLDFHRRRDAGAPGRREGGRRRRRRHEVPARGGRPPSRVRRQPLQRVPGEPALGPLPAGRHVDRPLGLRDQRRGAGRRRGGGAGDVLGARRGAARALRARAEPPRLPRVRWRLPRRVSGRRGDRGGAARAALRRRVRVAG